MVGFGFHTSYLHWPCLCYNYGKLLHGATGLVCSNHAGDRHGIDFNYRNSPFKVVNKWIKDRKSIEESTEKKEKVEVVEDKPESHKELFESEHKFVDGRPDINAGNILPVYSVLLVT